MNIPVQYGLVLKLGDGDRLMDKKEVQAPMHLPSPSPGQKRRTNREEGKARA